MKKTIFIANETKVREFDGRLLLASNLVEDFDVKIGSRSGIKRELLATINGIFIPKSLSKEEIPFYRKLKERGHKIVLIHAEGTALFHDIEEALKVLFPKECDPFVETYIVSGIEIKDAMLKHLKFIQTERIHVAGDPRFDLLKPNYLEFWKKDIKKLNKKYGEFVLINTNFATGNAKVGNEIIKAFYKNNSDYSEVIKEKYLYKHEYIHEVMLDYIDAVKELSLKFKELNFVIRPHPSESHLPYNEAFHESPNVFVTHEGNVTKWILASKAVIHYDCTTGVEAVLANKPCISYTPKVDKSILAWLPVLVSNQIEDLHDLAQTVGHLDQSSKAYELNTSTKDILGRYLFNYTDESSAVIAEIIKKSKFEWDYSLSVKLNFSQKMQLMKARMKSVIILFLFDLGVYKQKGSNSLRKFSSVSKIEIKRKLFFFRNKCVKYKKLKISLIGYDVVSIKLPLR